MDYDGIDPSGGEPFPQVGSGQKTGRVAVHLVSFQVFPEHHVHHPLQGGYPLGKADHSMLHGCHCRGYRRQTDHSRCRKRCLQNSPLALT